MQIAKLVVIVVLGCIAFGLVPMLFVDWGMLWEKVWAFTAGASWTYFVIVNERCRKEQ